jgi:hypothetical protein
LSSFSSHPSPNTGASPVCRAGTHGSYLSIEEIGGYSAGLAGAALYGLCQPPGNFTWARGSGAKGEIEMWMDSLGGATNISARMRGDAIASVASRICVCSNPHVNFFFCASGNNHEGIGGRGAKKRKPRTEGREMIHWHSSHKYFGMRLTTERLSGT